MRLLPTQKNELYDLIEASNLSPLLFDFKEETNKFGAVIKSEVILKNHPYFFNVYETFNRIRLTITPSFSTFRQEIIVDIWIEVGNRFSKWLNI